jgi:Putative Actinobacterial Holin-X, holin superfamily III
VAQRQQTAEPVIADAVADVAHSAQRIIEERVELLRLEVRDDLLQIFKASALGASGVVALAVAVGMAAGSVTWNPGAVDPVRGGAGITALVTAVVGVILTRMARTRLPGADAGADASRSGGHETRMVRAGPAGHEGHDVEVSTT